MIFSFDLEPPDTLDLSSEAIWVVSAAIPETSRGELRRIEGWYFDRDQAIRSAALGCTRSLARSEGGQWRAWQLSEDGYYLVDGPGEPGELDFAYLKLESGALTRVARERVAEAMYALQGVEESRQALREHAWARAWERAHYADRETALEAQRELIDALREALAELDEPDLEGRPDQLPWATALRARALGRLRGLYKSFASHPSRPAAYPHLHYALYTAAYNLKTTRAARTFIGADYHIQRGDIVEILDRFAANGRKRYKPRGRAQRLTQQDLATLRALAPPRA